MENNKKVFRDKNMEAIKSPEELDRYLKVTSPGMWILLIAIIVVLIGVCSWGVLGHITTTSKVAVVAEKGKTICMVPDEALDAAISDREITIEGHKYSMEPNTVKPMKITEDTNVYVMLAGDLEEGDIVYPVKLEKSLESGVYSGTIVTETLTPASFLFN